MQRIKRTIVAAALISKDKKILLGKPREGGVYPDCWHIPGGGVELGETNEQALIREIKEETGLDISDLHQTLLSDADTGESQKTDSTTGERFIAVMHFHTYRVDLPSNAENINISHDDDFQSSQWVAIPELKNYKLTPPSKKIFTDLGWLS